MSVVEPATFRADPPRFSLRDSCPTCDQTIPPERVSVVTGRLAALERDISASLTAQFERVRADDLATAQRTLAQAQAEAAQALNQARTEAAAQIGEAQAAAAGTEARVRGELEQAFQHRWNDQLSALGETHRAELAQRDARSAAMETALLSRLTQATQERDQSIRELSEQLAKAQEQQAEEAKAARDATLLLQKAKLDAKDFEQRLRAELAEDTKRQLAAQAAELEATNKKNVEQLSARLADADLATKAAVEATRTESLKREAAAQTNLREALGKLNAAEARRTEIEQQLAAAEQNKATEIANVRAVLEADKTSAVLAERSKHYEATQKLTSDLDDLRRKYEKKTADELGEGAELVLFEELKRAFKGDLISEVKRGTQGADLVHEIRANGVACGKLIYDCKNRKDWKTEYATKLRADQIAARADHAILSSNKFPGGKRQLHIEDHVIVACPARVIALATLLREQVITMHTLRVSNDERGQKTTKLYEFIASPRFPQLLDSVNAQLSKLEKMDEDERKAHETLLLKRGKAYKAIEKANGDLRFEISQIIGGLADQTEGDSQ